MQRQFRNSRRNFLLASGALVGGGLSTGGASPLVAQESPSETGPASPPAKLRYCLNTSTINHAQVPVREQFRIAATTGYDSVEIWMRDIEQFVREGGTIADLAKEVADLGLGIDSAIAFGNWIVDDDGKRQAGIDQCRRDMETLRALGGRRIAAPPAGATRQPGLNLDSAAARYHELLEVGKSVDVLPQLELWGSSANLSTLPQLLYVAAAANHPDACVLLDVYHLYKGGSDFSNLGLVPGTQMHCLHMNDYPRQPSRDAIGDQDRVYPGDGIAPMNHILRTLFSVGFAGALSLELFNRTYWEQPPVEVARIGLDKMKTSVAQAFERK